VPAFDPPESLAVLIGAEVVVGFGDEEVQSKAASSLGRKSIASAFADSRPWSPLLIPPGCKPSFSRNYAPE
jgi:hypothetical protein